MNLTCAARCLSTQEIIAEQESIKHQGLLRRITTLRFNLERAPTFQITLDGIIARRTRHRTKQHVHRMSTRIEANATGPQHFVMKLAGQTSFAHSTLARSTYRITQFIMSIPKPIDGSTPEMSDRNSNAGHFTSHNGNDSQQPRNDTNAGAVIFSIHPEVVGQDAYLQRARPRKIVVHLSILEL
eukprot:3033287-Pleurochrysis_carterae.AAC.6